MYCHTYTATQRKRGKGRKEERIIIIKRQERRKEAGKKGRKRGSKQGMEGGREGGRNEESKEGVNGGRKAENKQGRKEERKENSKQAREDESKTDRKKLVSAAKSSFFTTQGRGVDENDVPLSTTRKLNYTRIKDTLQTATVRYRERWAVESNPAPLDLLTEVLPLFLLAPLG